MVTRIEEELLLRAEYLLVKRKHDKVYRSDVVVKVDKHLLNRHLAQLSNMKK